MRRPLVIAPAEAVSDRLCVVHLVRAANGPGPFQRFLQAMRNFPAGVDHDLVLAFKGFAVQHDAEPYLSAVRDLGAEPLFFADSGFDLGVYFSAASHLQRARYCFLNSFSEPLVDGWLAKLDEVLSTDGVGMVSASGSWNSSRSWLLHSLGLRTPYKGLLPPRAVMRSQLAEIEQERSGTTEAVGEIDVEDRKGPTRLVRRAIGVWPELIGDFESFPAHHLRTNAFAISHSMLARLQLHELHEKRDAYRLESGRNSLTRQVQRLGLRALVVDRDGKAYDQDDWHLSLTLWQRSQEGLMVADNQTRSYDRGGPDRRRLLSVMAWGMCADAGLAPPSS